MGSPHAAHMQPICGSYVECFQKQPNCMWPICCLTYGNIWRKTNQHTLLQPKHMGHIWAAYGPHMGTWFATYGAFSTYGEENPSESTTYGQHMGLFFKHMGFFWNIKVLSETYRAFLKHTCGPGLSWKVFVSFSDLPHHALFRYMSFFFSQKFFQSQIWPDPDISAKEKRLLEVSGRNGRICRLNFLLWAKFKKKKGSSKSLGPQQKHSLFVTLWIGPKTYTGQWSLPEQQQKKNRLLRLCIKREHCSDNLVSMNQAWLRSELMITWRVPPPHHPPSPPPSSPTPETHTNTPKPWCVCVLIGPGTKYKI